MATSAARHAAWRLGYRTAGRLSDGVRTGLEHGFDSGPFMAHVYSDRPAGKLRLGRAIDRRLLSCRTCTAFREIAELAKEALRGLLDERSGHETFVVDLAAGPASYLLEVLDERRRPEVRALLRDIDPTAIELAAAAAADRGLERVETALGDALDAGDLASISPAPDVAVELGLYGMFGDERIAPHFHDLATRLAPAALVCNVQNQNPEIGHIAGVWPSRDGGRCEWRLRPLPLLLEWAEEAGFAPSCVRQDTNRIYSVLTLRRA